MSSSGKFQVGLREDNAPKKVPNHRGHTDIFGIGEQAQPTPKTNIPIPKTGNNVTEETDGVKENNTIQVENKTDHVNGNVPVVAGTPQRIRMPPGGFSSGLW